MSTSRARVPTGIAEIDRTLGGGLEAGAIHEVVGHLDDSAGRGPRAWSPPIGWLTHLAFAASRARWIVWIGAEIWPYGQTLAAHAGVLDRSVFVDARTPAERVWSGDCALRCAGVGCVVVDATRFDIGATRRLQLGAKRESAIGLLARPPDEVHALSVATTRWTARRASPGSSSRASNPGWIVELLRCKGVQPDSDAPRSWGVEWCCATCDLRLASNVVDRSGGASVETVGRPAIVSA